MNNTTKACPECGSVKYRYENTIGEGYRVCADCEQEWWIDIDYSKLKEIEHLVMKNSPIIK